MKLPKPKITGVGSLTQREKQVLEWVTRGKTNSEIGVILGISGYTVAKHVEHIFEKLGVENRVVLAASYGSPSDKKRS